MKKERLLMLNGSFCEMPIIQEAKALGYYVVTTGNAPELVGHKVADEYISCDYSDKEAVLDLVRKHHIDRIVSCANDFGVLTAAYVAEQMGWKGHDTYRNAICLHHKDEFKQYCEAHHIPAPLSKVFHTEAEAISYARAVQYPIIVKANDLTGGKGIMRADQFEQATDAIRNAFERSRDKTILIEPFIEGTQHTFVSFVSNHRVICDVSCNCYSWRNPYLIQSETFPADSIDELRDTLKSIVEYICDDLNLVDGIFALQYILKDGKPYIIEMMRRCFGNQFLTLANMASGFPWERAYVMAETGQSCAHIVKEKAPVPYCGHYGVMAKNEGIVRSYRIPEEFQPHIFQQIEMLPPGAMLTDSLNQRIAYLFYRFDSKEQMEQAVRRLHNDICIEVDPIHE